MWTDLLRLGIRVRLPAVAATAAAIVGRRHDRDEGEKKNPRQRFPDEGVWWLRRGKEENLEEIREVL
jgi:hypothetical protein